MIMKCSETTIHVYTCTICNTCVIKVSINTCKLHKLTELNDFVNKHDNCKYQLR